METQKQELEQLIERILNLIPEIEDKAKATAYIGQICELERELTLLEEQPN